MTEQNCEPEMSRFWIVIIFLSIVIPILKIITNWLISLG